MTPNAMQTTKQTTVHQLKHTLVCSLRERPLLAAGLCEAPGAQPVRAHGLPELAAGCAAGGLGHAQLREQLLPCLGDLLVQLGGGVHQVIEGAVVGLGAVPDGRAARQRAVASLVLQARVVEAEAQLRAACRVAQQVSRGLAQVPHRQRGVGRRQRLELLNGLRQVVVHRVHQHLQHLRLPRLDAKGRVGEVSQRGHHDGRLPVPHHLHDKLHDARHGALHKRDRVVRRLQRAALHRLYEVVVADPQHDEALRVLVLERAPPDGLAAARLVRRVLLRGVGEHGAAAVGVRARGGAAVRKVVTAAVGRH
mmetsp:Transcript_7371/g.18301  ORF Transcript_7371/g.18301 Transcript_7371/m.18301 type:complete len:308 (-) Transcript_7371:286-1209(-)